MEGETLTPIESAIQFALKNTAEADDLTAEQVFEVAERGRNHPEFDSRMSRITRSPSSLALYIAARETRPGVGLRRVAELWVEGFRALPAWFDSATAVLQRAPRLAYRSGAGLASSKLALISPDPANQSVAPGFKDWKPAEGPETVSISVVESDNAILVKLRSLEDDWSLDTEYSYRFAVLSSDDADKARWAAENADDTPIASSIVFCSVGLFAEAEKLLGRWPDDLDLQAYADLIRQACQARRADGSQLYLSFNR